MKRKLRSLITRFQTRTSFLSRDLSQERAALVGLMALDFPLPKIRKALAVLKGVKLEKLADSAGIAKSNLSNTIQGKRTNHKAQKAFSEALGLTVEELFDKEG